MSACQITSRTTAPTKATPLKLALAIGTLKERQALEADKNPEAQAKLRDEARMAYQEVLNRRPTDGAAKTGLARAKMGKP